MMTQGLDDKTFSILQVQGDPMTSRIETVCITRIWKQARSNGRKVFLIEKKSGESLGLMATW